MIKKRFEYKMERISGSETDESVLSKLNEWGADGWELVWAADSDDTIMVILVFKREL